MSLLSHAPASARFIQDVAVGEPCIVSDNWGKLTLRRVRKMIDGIAKQMENACNSTEVRDFAQAFDRLAAYEAMLAGRPLQARPQLKGQRKAILELPKLTLTPQPVDIPPSTIEPGQSVNPQATDNQQGQ